MKQFARRICVVLLAACILASMLMVSVPTEAATTSSSTGKRYNIMLVIDGSGSLITPGVMTDPNGMRYELINDLLGVLEDDGHYVGAVVFSGNAGTGTSDADMNSGILCNTGMISLDPSQMTPDGSLPKDYIAQKITNAGVDARTEGKTDIGTALLVAERELAKAQAQNGLESLIFLFTDGITDVSGAVRTKSEENQNTATLECRQNGIRLFGAFLNNGGKLPNNEITEIVCAANGINPNSEEFLCSYVELKDASTCHEAVNTLLQFLGYLGPLPPPVTGSIEDEFTIPGIGVEEMNIRLYSYNGADLPDMDVELIRPDGTVLSGTALNGMSRNGRTFRVYKLVQPMSGTWKLKVTVPKDNKIAYVYSRVFSKHVDAELTISPSAANLHVNANADFTAALSQNGVAVTDPLAYTGYECLLEITNLADNTAVTYPIAGNSGSYVYPMTLTEYGSFAARVIFKCDSFEVASEPINYDLQNHIPQADSPVALDLKCGLLQDEETEIDLLDYVNDVEDGKNLSIVEISATCDEDAYTYDQGSGELVLQNKQIGDAQLVFTVTDSQGASVELCIEVATTDVTLMYLLIALIVLIVVFIVVLCVIRARGKIAPDGDLSVLFELKVGDEKKNIDLLLPVPGRDAPSKTTLHALLKKRLEDDGERHQGVTSEKIKDALADLGSQLDKVVISKAIVNIKGQKVGGVAVKAGKKNDTMPHKRSVEFAIGDLDMSLTYTRDESDDAMFDDDLDFAAPKKEKKGKKRPERDVADFDDDF